MKYIVLSLFFLIQTIVFSQTIEWQKCIGGSSYEYALGMTETQNGDVLITGASYSNDGNISSNYGEEDVYVSRISSDGNVIWSYNFGGSGMERASGIIELQDGSILVSGFTSSNDQDVSSNIIDLINFKGWCFKLSPNGDLLWEKTYYLVDNEYNYIVSLNENSNGNIFFTGYSSSNKSFFGLMDSNGLILWSQMYQDLWSGNSAFETHITSDSEIILYYQSGLLQKYDMQGNLIWENDISYPGLYKISGYFELNNDEFYLIRDFSYGERIDKMKINNLTGELLDSVLLYSIFDNSPMFYMESAKFHTNGNFVLGGYYQGLNSQNEYHADYQFISYSIQNQIVAQNNFGGSQNEMLREVFLAQNGSIYGFGKCSSIDGDIVGSFNQNAQDYTDTWLIKVNSTLGIELSKNNKIEIYPNPSNNLIKINGVNENTNYKIIIFNTFGKQVMISDKTEINIHTLVPGQYIIKVLEDNSESFFKFNKI
jgi:hypothetical protein